MRVNVLRRHIDGGIPREPRECAIAQAIYEAIDDQAAVVEVLPYGIWVNGRFSRPKGLKAFVEAFDRGEAVAPTTFEIAV